MGTFHAFGLSAEHTSTNRFGEAHFEDYAAEVVHDFSVTAFAQHSAL